MSSFCTECKSYSHFFSKKFQHICVSLNVNFNESFTNNIVSFEQLGPDLLVTIVDADQLADQRQQWSNHKVAFFIGGLGGGGGLKFCDSSNNNNNHLPNPFCLELVGLTEWFECAEVLWNIFKNLEIR